MVLSEKKVNDKLRLYYQGNQLVAAATNPHGLEYTETTHYACLPSVWEQDNQTSWVTQEELNRLAAAS